MATLMKITPEQLRQAKKCGFKRKAPKKPKRGATVSAMENYIVRYNEWVKAAKSCKSQKETLARKKATLKKQIFGI
jgi:hypothetical protein